MKNELFNSAECVLITNPSDLFYFTDYENADAKLLLLPEGKYYFTDARYFEEITSVATDTEIMDISDFNKFLSERKFHTVGIDTELSFQQHAIWEEQGISAVDLRSDIAKMRAVKSEEEIFRITEAQKITDRSFSDMLNLLREGMTEKEGARELICCLYHNGADGLAFEPIVAFGANTSKPHAHPTETVLQKGMPVLMDFGAKYKGYCSDMTRTVYFGKPTEEFEMAYQTVLRTQTEALQFACAEKTGTECHGKAAEVFSEKNIDRFFTHSLGHGLGIDIHETPSLSPRYTQKIPEKAVTSFEPGLYFPGKFGIRIEDIAIFEKTTVRNLTNSEKMLIIL